MPVVLAENVVVDALLKGIHSCLKFQKVSFFFLIGVPSADVLHHLIHCLTSIGRPSLIEVNLCINLILLPAGPDSGCRWAPRTTNC